MKRTMVAVAVALVVGACSADTPNEVLTPEFNKGGFGNPHFVADATNCTFDENFAGSCVFQISGLANLAEVTVTASLNISVSYDCINNGGNIPRAWSNLTGTGSKTVNLAGLKGNGNVTGKIDLAMTDGNPVDGCPSPVNGNGLKPTNVVVNSASYSLNAWVMNTRRDLYNLPGLQGSLQ